MKKISATERLQQLNVSKQFVLDGGYNATPFKDLPKTTYNFGGGYIEGKMYAITADTAGGKTKYIKATLFQMWRNYYANKIGKKFHVIFFALEEDYDEFLDSVFVTMYEKKYEKEILQGKMPAINYGLLNSFYKEILPESVWIALTGLIPLVDNFMSHFTLSDIDNPTGMYKFCKDQCEILGHGKHHYKERVADNGETVRDYHYYERLDPSLQIIVVVDHMSALRAENSKTETKHSSMEKWTSYYSKKLITKRWKWTCVDLLQQMFDQDRGGGLNQKGDIIVRKVEPKLETLGNNKEIARYYYVIIGLFNPYHYRIAEYPLVYAYDISFFEDSYRCGIILKNRYGMPGKKISYYFYGNSFLWKEMPMINIDGGINLALEQLTEDHRKRKIILDNQNKY